MKVTIRIGCRDIGTITVNAITFLGAKNKVKRFLDQCRKNIYVSDLLRVIDPNLRNRISLAVRRNEIISVGSVSRAE